MAVRYVYSGAAGTGTGADWTNAHTTFAAAITASSAGDTFYLASDHSESFGVSTTFTMKGTTSAPDQIITVDRTGSVPPVAADLRQATAAQFATAGGNFAVNINGTAFYARGLYIKPGDSGARTGASMTIGATGFGRAVFEACTFHIDSSSGTPQMTVGAATARVSFRNVTVRFGATGQSVLGAGWFDWRNDSGVAAVHASSTIPTTLFAATSAGSPTLAGLDLSSVNTTIFGNALPLPRASLINCKLHASATITSTPAGSGSGVYIDVIGSDSGTANYRNERYGYAGTLTTETTIKRTAGASDGTTAYSWKVVTTANSKQVIPFETFDGIIWNDTTGSSKTLTVHTVTDNVTLTDAEAWLEVEYLGSSSQPISYRADDMAATILTTGANQTSDSGEAWTTTGLTTPVKQALAVTFTPQMKGAIRWRVKVAKASTTVYVCPKADLA